MNKPNAFYTKEGRRYYPVEGDVYMPADGIWLVDLKGSSKRRIVKTSDIPELNNPEYLAMQAADHEDLSKYLMLTKHLHIVSTLSVGKGLVSWHDKPHSDYASDIIRFLSKNKEDRQKLILKLRAKWVEITKNWRGIYEIRDNRGRLVGKITEDEVWLETPYEDIPIEDLKSQLKSLEERVRIYKRVIREKSK